MMTTCTAQATHNRHGRQTPAMIVKVLSVMNIPFTIMVKPWRRTDIDHQLSWAQAHLAMQSASSQINDFLHKVDERFSPYQPHSLVSNARHGDWSALLADREFHEIYGKAALAKTLTHGAFNVYHHGEYDPTGLVKGWAIETAVARFLRPLLRPTLQTMPNSAMHSPVEAVAINGGGDIQAEVSQHSDFAWRVGVEDPRDISRLIWRYDLHNGGVATSGFSKRGIHITHTQTDEVLQQLTIISESVEDADMWATAGISSGLHSWMSLAQEHSLNAIAVRTNGDILYFINGNVHDRGNLDEEAVAVVGPHPTTLNTKRSKEPSC
jgi:thiamine biosynthesis lipoprotein